jgi:Fic family protein
VGQESAYNRRMPADKRYLETHSHVDFRLDLRPLTPDTWALLGEAKSKAQHVARALVSPERAEELMSVYLSRGVLATTAIEGNTLSEEEVRRILDHDLELPASRQYLQREVENVLAAYNLVREQVLTDPDRPLSVEQLAEYNRLILDGLELEEGVVPGEIREHSVVVGPYRAVPAEDAEYLLRRLCEWLEADDFMPRSAAPELAAPLAIVRAIVAHLYLAWIHPFGDGNGRTARLVELRILLAAGFPVPACQLLSNHYNLTRSEYYRQLTISTRGVEGVASFLRYAAQGFVDQLREQLDVIWTQQFEDRWQQYVHQRFGGRRSQTGERRLRLVLAVSTAARAAGEPVPKEEMTTLTPGLAAAYATKTEKTLTRDLNAAVELGLLRREGGGWAPADEAIQGLQPAAVDGVL